MTWFAKRKEDLPESIRELTPEQLDAAVKDKKILEDKLAALELAKTESDKKVTTLNSEFQTVKDKLTAIEGNTRKEEVRDAPKGPTSVFIDEDRAFQERLDGSGYAQVALQSGFLAARSTFRETVNTSKREGYILNKYQTEIDNIMGNEPPARKVDPRAWMTAYMMVKGMHESDISKDGFFAETSSGGSGAGDTLPGQKTEADKNKLTDKELEVVKRMKITPERYLAQRNKMEVGSDNV